MARVLQEAISPNAIIGLVIIIAGIVIVGGGVACTATP
jgi:multidrug transporter EmrE-like cation transporter